MRRRAGWHVMVVVAVLAMVAAACGSSSGGSASSGGSSSSGGSTATKSTWTVGTVNDVTGAEASSLGGANRGMMAWADWVNAHGGINGHKIKMVALDTGFNPSTALSEVKQLVEQDHIIALIGEQSSFDPVFAPYLEQQKVPAVGSAMINLPDWTNPDFFPEGAAFPTLIYGAMYLAHKAGANKLAYMYCAESPACAGATPLVKSAASSVGVDLSYITSVSGSAPSYVAPCLAAKSSGAEAMWIADNSSVIERVAQACEGQGFHPTQVSTDGSVTVNWATSPVMQGTQIAQPDIPFSDTSLPETQAMRQALDKYAPGLVGSSLFGEDIIYGWASGELFKAAAEAGNLGDNPTPAQVIQGLYKLKDETLGGMAPKLNYTPGQGTLIKCFFTMAVQNNQFTEPDGHQTTCQP